MSVKSIRHFTHRRRRFDSLPTTVRHFTHHLSTDHPPAVSNSHATSTTCQPLSTA